MHYKRIIPCLDLKDGRLVKGVQFLNLKDAGDPIQKAIQYARDGADELVMLNISTSPAGYQDTLKIIRKTAKQLTIPVIAGGGIRSLDTIQDFLQNGAYKVVVNTAALENPSLISTAAVRFGSRRIVVAVDALRSRTAPKSSPSWEVYSGSGRQATGLEAVSWCIEAEQRGAGEVLLTSIDSDGTRDGYDLELLASVAEAISIPVIASGGAGSPEHLVEALTSGKAQAALVASMLHYGNYTVTGLKNYLAEQGLPVRLQGGG
ncbi:MAG TPA: imidazole glycerol phosphate synthase subunit HisF [Firmicutes bacterium]|nr:imidazole glycerol phosphate synthase subunit HisF [Bacillota bacterium]